MKLFVPVVVFPSAVSLIASPIPPLRNAPLPTFGVTLPVVPKARPAKPILPFDEQVLDTLTISGSVYYMQLETNRRLRSHGVTSSPAVTGAALSRDADLLGDSVEFGPHRPDETTPLSTAAPRNSGRLLLQPDYVARTIAYNVSSTADTNEDVEPTVYTLNYGGQPVTVSVAQKWPVGQNAHLFFRRTTDFANFTGGELPIIPGYEHMADPYLAGNPYTNVGESPSTFYCSGIVYDADIRGASAVVVWRSTDGGNNWAAVPVRQNIPTSPADPAYNRFMDKPAIAVSTNTTFLGRVYVVYTDADLTNNGQNQLRLARGRIINNVFQFDDDELIATGRVTAGQVVVNNNNGEIYVVYARYNATTGSIQHGRAPVRRLPSSRATS